MTSEILVAVLSCIGTLGGSLFGIFASSKLTIYRIDRLEEKVNKHNNLIERTFKIESRLDVIESELDTIKREVN